MQVIRLSIRKAMGAGHYYLTKSSLLNRGFDTLTWGSEQRNVVGAPMRVDRDCSGITPHRIASSWMEGIRYDINIMATNHRIAHFESQKAASSAVQHRVGLPLLADGGGVAVARIDQGVVGQGQ